MKFKSLLLVVGFIPAMVMAQGAPKTASPIAPGASSSNNSPTYPLNPVATINALHGLAALPIHPSGLVIAPPVGSGTPSAGTPGANGGGVKPGAAPLVVKPDPSPATSTPAPAPLKEGKKVPTS